MTANTPFGETSASATSTAKKWSNGSMR
jgi:hypothetical protein